MNELTLAPHSLCESLQAAQTSSEVSFEEARAIRWLSDVRNAAPPAPVAAPPVGEEASVAPMAVPCASPAAIALQPSVTPAAQPAELETAAAPEQVAATLEVVQVAALDSAPFAASL